METAPLHALMPKPGSKLGGKYALERVIGQGGMAVVYEATHLRLRQRVAIKVLVPKIAEIAEIVHRFEREARALVQLHGPNVAHVIDVDTTPEGLPYIVMELLDGHDLAQEIAERKGDFPIEEAVGYVLQACAAMAEAHALGIVHRDLKPANLFLTGAPPDRLVKVLDFGVSKLLEGDTNMTETEAVLGTPVYMSPEQIEAAKGVDGRADVWSLGVILYELLTFELPFGGRTASQALTSVMVDAPKPLRSRRPDAPRELVAIVMRALSKDPDKRYQDVTELAKALAPFGPPSGTAMPPSRPAGDATHRGGASAGAPSSPRQPRFAQPDDTTIRGERTPVRSESGVVVTLASQSPSKPWKTVVAVIVLAAVLIAAVYALGR
jgi:serine/threonine-protein kinase